MPTDRYTKIVLTVIAACLLYLCFRQDLSLRTVRAQGATTTPQEVKIVGVSTSDVIPVKLADLGANVIVPVGIAGGRGVVPVSIQGENPNFALPVGIKGVGYDSNGKLGWYPLNVKQGN